MWGNDMTEPAATRARPGDNPVVQVENVSFSFNHEPIIERANLTIRHKDFVWVVGPNGGGKTTLMKIILGLLQPDTGRVRVFGNDIDSVRRRIGYVPQQPQLDRRFPITVNEVVLMGRLSGGARPGGYSAEDREAARSALDMVDLAIMAPRSLHELSGGQQRRLLIARALACEPDLLILDEPTANLDRAMEAELFDLLRDLNKRMTVLMVSHDPAFVSDFVEHVVCVNRVVSVHPTASLDQKFIAELYGAPVRLVRHDLHNQKNQGRNHSESANPE
jgi:zinc transport system ATP-binding protein